MSKYMQTETQFTDGDHLVAALKDMGFQPMVYETPINLIGYHGDRRLDLAHIVIPRAQIGRASNDVGFIQENGVYRAIISEFDSSRFSKPWLGKLAQSYQEHKSLAVARAKGYTFLGKTYAQNAAGQQVVRLQFGVR